MAPPRLEAALKRLTAALDQMEAASARLARTGAERRDFADALALMQDDRARLAEALDAALARTATLEYASTEVSRRLGAAGLTLRRLLATEAGAAPGGEA